MKHSPSAIPNPPSRRHHRARGFTLIEAALTTVIVSTGVLSILAAQQAYHQKNDWAQRSGTAMLLANEIRELTLPLPLFDPINGQTIPGPDPGELTIDDYDDLDDFAGIMDAGGNFPGTTINPPIDALRRPILDMTQWTQVVTVGSVLESDIALTYTQDPGTTALTRVTVDVLYQGPGDPTPLMITQLSWLIGE